LTSQDTKTKVPISSEPTNWDFKHNEIYFDEEKKWDDKITD